MSSTPGWFPDPYDATQEQFWDGTSRTGDRRAVGAASPGAVPPPPPGAPPMGGVPYPPAGGPAYAPGYYVPPYGFPPPVKTNSNAIASLVLGLIGIFLCYLGFVPGIAALLLGKKGREEIAGSHGRQDGDGLAIAGMISGGLATCWLLIVLILIIGAQSSPSG